MKKSQARIDSPCALRADDLDSVALEQSIEGARELGIAIASKPNTAWMLQQARNLLMELDDRDRQVRFLIQKLAKVVG